MLGWTLFGRPFSVRAFAFASLLIVAAFSPIPGGGQNSTDEHLEEPGWWPRKTSDSLEEYVGSPACKSCHQAIAAEQERRLWPGHSFTPRMPEFCARTVN